MCVLVVYYGAYIYVCPYCSRLANTLEVFLLGSFIILLYIPFLPLRTSNLVTTDACGYPIPSANMETGVLAAVYCGTLVLSVIAVVITFGIKKFSQARQLRSATKRWFELSLSSKRKSECQPAQNRHSVVLLHYTTTQVDLTETLNEDKSDTVQDECANSNR